MGLVRLFASPLCDGTLVVFGFFYVAVCVCELQVLVCSGAPQSLRIDRVDLRGVGRKEWC
jgi:hypothetical protein